MKGWLANHSEDSFAKVKHGQERPFSGPSRKDWPPQAAILLEAVMPHHWSWELGDTYQLWALYSFNLSFLFC